MDSKPSTFLPDQRSLCDSHVEDGVALDGEQGQRGRHQLGVIRSGEPTSPVGNVFGEQGLRVLPN